MKKELKFIHITKCAGTFIENMAKQNNINWGRFHPEYYNWKKDNKWWHTCFDLIDEKVKNKYDWFMVVRNPYDRILSEYYCKNDFIYKNNIKHNKEDFNKYLIKKINNINTKGDHYTEQYRYLEKCNHKIYVLRFENLIDDLKALFKEYNIMIDVNKYNESNIDKNKSSKVYSVNDFSNELIQCINEKYNDDFKLFNYEKILRN